MATPSSTPAPSLVDARTARLAGAFRFAMQKRDLEQRAVANVHAATDRHRASFGGIQTAVAALAVAQEETNRAISLLFDDWRDVLAEEQQAARAIDDSQAHAILRVGT